ncbi:hypothetical protein Pfo_015686 [Paulownia fortunei]|nr:hypothetical protein Pfo_015686 [Paulownia fortunei]
MNKISLATNKPSKRDPNSNPTKNISLPTSPLPYFQAEREREREREMADIASSILLNEMAVFTVNSLLERTENELMRQLSLPEKITTGINNLKSELEMMKAFLRDIDARRDVQQELQVQVWVRQLRDIAHDIEDAVDMFAFQTAQQNATWYAPRRRSAGNDSIAALIEKAETNLKSLQEKRRRYVDFFSSHQASTTSTHHHHHADQNDHPVIAPLYTPEVEIVGFEKPRQQLASWVLDLERALQVMFVVGMGGSGKTTLARLVYQQLKGDFDCHVWLAASKSVESHVLLSNMFTELCGQSAECANQLSFIIDKLRNYLQDKRYLIVIDGLWVKDVWESVKNAFPKDSCGRVIITTQRGDIAAWYRENSVQVYNLQALPPEKALELFYKKSSPQYRTYPPSPGSENLLRQCEGLPLGIVEIRKLVCTRGQNESQLKILHDSLKSQLSSSGPLWSIARVFLLSYNDLPDHLKYCILYMTMFAEDYSVKRRTLIRLWMAEDFIKGQTGKQPEDIGEEYLQELIERNLIQASELDFDGRPRTCRVHNLVQKVFLSKSEGENFCTVCTDLQGDISETTRRLSIQNCEFVMANRILRRARTLFTSKFYLKIPPSIGSSLKLLKILHLDGASVDAFPSGICDLLLLKYLCLSNTRIKRVPRSIGRLQLLETLNLKQTFVTAVPNTLAKLEKLRHLLVCRYNIKAYIAFDSVQGFKVPSQVSKLTRLQKLSFAKADTDHRLIQELRKLTQLRKLGITDLPKDSGPLLCDTLQMLSNLHSLSLASLQRVEVLDIQNISCPPTLLQRLYLKGRLEQMPHWISKLRDLVRIRLKWSRLTDDNNPIPILGQLPNLLELQLLDAYTGYQLHFNAGRFVKLKTLEFEQMEQLRTIVVHNGALPCLQILIIRQCEKLSQIPVGINNLAQLKELHLIDLPPDLVDPLRRKGRLRYLVQHVKNIYSARLQNFQQWAREDLS